MPHLKFIFFIEDFGGIGPIQSQLNTLNFGGGYNFKDNLTLDLFVANGLNHTIFYAGFICTWVLKTKKNKN